MPYIEPELRTKIDETINTLIKLINGPGMLNYAMTRLWHGLLRDSSIRYVHLRNIVGDTVCAMLEFYRTVAAPYEDRKGMENGFIGLLEDENGNLREDV